MQLLYCYIIFHSQRKKRRLSSWQFMREELKKTNTGSLAFSAFSPLVSYPWKAVIVCSSVSFPQGLLDTLDSENLFPSLWRCLPFFHGCLAGLRIVSFWSLCFTFLINLALPDFQLSPFSEFVQLQEVFWSRRASRSSWTLASRYFLGHSLFSSWPLLI